MWKNSFKCKLCDKPMPPHVFKGHLRLRHQGDPKLAEVELDGEKFLENKKLQSKITANEKEIANLVREPNPSKIEDGVLTKEEEKNHTLYELVSDQFDWGEVYPCGACGEEYPAKAMPFHSWVKHRV